MGALRKTIKHNYRR